MIQLRSILEVADNTGARKAALIQRMGQQTAYAHVGDIVTVHIKESTADATVNIRSTPVLTSGGQWPTWASGPCSCGFAATPRRRRFRE